tara:strand:+ start:244 stop:525 length:282 start_codon:yes stop_codon:yes gene_type:complete
MSATAKHVGELSDAVVDVVTESVYEALEGVLSESVGASVGVFVDSAAVSPPSAGIGSSDPPVQARATRPDRITSTTNHVFKIDIPPRIFESGN